MAKKKWEIEVGDRLLTNRDAGGIWKKDAFYGTIARITDDAYIVERSDGKEFSYSKENEDSVFRRWLRKE